MEELRSYGLTLTNVSMKMMLREGLGSEKCFMYRGYKFNNSGHVSVVISKNKSQDEYFTISPT